MKNALQETAMTHSGAMSLCGDTGHRLIYRYPTLAGQEKMAANRSSCLRKLRARR